jgi:hypothetical protein
MVLCVWYLLDGGEDAGKGSGQRKQSGDDRERAS